MLNNEIAGTVSVTPKVATKGIFNKDWAFVTKRGTRKTKNFESRFLTRLIDDEHTVRQYLVDDLEAEGRNMIAAFRFEGKCYAVTYQLVDGKVSHVDTDCARVNPRAEGKFASLRDKLDIKGANTTRKVGQKTFKSRLEVADYLVEKGDYDLINDLSDLALDRFLLVISDGDGNEDLKCFDSIEALVEFASDEAKLMEDLDGATVQGIFDLDALGKALAFHHTIIVAAPDANVEPLPNSADDENDNGRW